MQSPFFKFERTGSQALLTKTVNKLSMQSKMDLGHETSMVKVATALTEQALAIHQRSVNQGPMPDQKKLARELISLVASRVCIGHPSKKELSQNLILMVGDTLNGMPLNSECNLHVRKILLDLLPHIFNSVGLYWL